MKNIRKNSGFTLIEILVASTIAAAVLLIAFSSVGNIYLSQKKINITQDFYDETRFLMERLAQLGRNNTIDYDRFFEEIGPDNTLSLCSNFNFNQLPSGASNNSNVETTRKDPDISYETIFYWDTDNDGIQDQNLGGNDQTGTLDDCTEAFHGTLDTLFLINGDRTIRTAIKQDGTTIQLQRQIGFDDDADGKIDTWTAAPTGNQCADSNPELPLGGEALCNVPHDWIAISPPAVIVEDFSFLPSPTRDPFLAFRVDEAQIHPNVFFSLQTSLADHGKFNLSSAPEVLLQTTVSSRVFGNTRK